MVPLRLLRPLTASGLTLALVSCQTNDATHSAGVTRTGKGSRLGC